VRWIWEVPEEQGLGLDPNWYVVHVPELTPEKPVRPGGMSLWPKDQPAGDYWWPGESYLAMDRFWSGETRLKFEEHLKKDTAHSAEEVLAAWHRTVGYGLNLVVNFVPRPRGDLPPAEVERFAQAGRTLRRVYARNLASAGTATASSSAAGHGPAQAVDGNPATWWEATGSDRTARLELDLGHEVEFDRVALREAITQGQAIAAFRVLAKCGGAWQPLCTGGTVGRQRIAVFRSLRASCLRVEMTTTGRPATLREMGLYRDQQ
jgi:alpha-L-fucosidase